MRKLHRLSALGLLIVILSGCSSEAPTDSGTEWTPPAPTEPQYHYRQVPVSEPCLSNMKRAYELAKTDVGQVPAPGDAEIKASVDLCGSVDEWMSALDIYPGAFGVWDWSASDIGSIGILCYPIEETVARGAPVCIDYQRLGLPGY